MSLTSLFQLNSYWWLLIWLFAVGFFFYFVKHEQTEPVLGKQERRWQPWAAVIVALPYVLWAGCRGYVGDTYAYRETFKSMPSLVSEWGTYLADITKDKGFSVFGLIVKSVVGNHPVIYFLVLALIQMVCMAAVFRKFSSSYWFSIFVFIASTDYMSWMFNGVRQFLAVTVIFAATALIVNKKFIPAVLVILFASTFHQSALLMLPVIFIIQGKAFNKMTLICIALAVLALVFADQFTDILETLMEDTQYSSVVSDWESWEDDGMNPIRVLVYSVPTILAILGIRIIRAEDDPVINLCVNAGIITTALGIIAMGTSGIFMGRLPIYTSLYSSCILLPWEIDHIFTEQSAKIMKVLAVVLYCAFFYYQMHNTWGAI